MIQSLSHEWSVINKELLLAAYRDIPAESMYMRMNKGWGMFYMYQGEEKQGGKGRGAVSRYLRYTNDWVVLNSMQCTWGEFCTENGVFEVSEFKLYLARTYPIDVLGVDQAIQMVERKPKSATHYNILSGKYHRMGQGEYTEMHSYYGNMSHWLETSHLNEDISDTFIHLERLGVDLKK